MMKVKERYISYALAGLLLLVGLGWFLDHRASQRELQSHLVSELQAASSYIYDANWALQQIREPKGSEPKIRGIIETLKMARERLNGLRGQVLWEVPAYEEAVKLSDRVHVVAIGLETQVNQGDYALFPGMRRYLALLSEHLPFPEHDPDGAKFRAGFMAFEQLTNIEGFSMAQLPPVSPAMRLTIRGSYAPVRRGASCWQEGGRTHCTDVADPTSLVGAAPPAPPGSSAQVGFAWAPEPGSVRVWRLLGNGEREEVSLNADLAFTLPAQSGTYAFLAEARWPEGSGSYGFGAAVQ